MKLMAAKLSFVVLVLSLILTGSLSAQSKKGATTKKAAAAAKKPAAKKTSTASKDAKKKTAAKTSAKSTKKDTKADKRSAAKRKAPAKQTAAEKRKAAKEPANQVAAAKGKKGQKLSRAEARREAARRRAAAIAEQRRREAARRAAIARAIAFERGLKTETVENIAKDVTEGEDLRIRQAAVTALGSHAGSVVVMEAQTGKVLTIVNQDWAVRSGVKPCSTIKLVTGVAGLNEDVISKEDGSIKNVPTRLNLDDALAYSNNGYFQIAGRNFGNSKMIEYAKELGLGEPTGLATEGEYAGKLPFGNNNPRIYSHGDDFEVTTLQLAVMVSAISNGGNRVLPRVPRNTVEKANFQPFFRDKVDLPSTSVRRVIPGMIGAAEYGTARRGVDADLGIAGKTGSCISKGSWVGLFASVAPIEKPKYAVVVITRGQRERGRHAAAVAGQIYKALGTHIVRTDRNLAQTEFKLKPKGSLDPKTAATLADEEDDSDAAATDVSQVGDAVNAPAESTTPAAAPDKTVREREVTVAPSPKKLVTKTGNSKPTFPPVVITYDKEAAAKKPEVKKKP